MPIAWSWRTRLFGSVGWIDQLQTASRWARGDAIVCWRASVSAGRLSQEVGGERCTGLNRSSARTAQFDCLQFFDEINKAIRLRLQTIQQFRVFQPAVGVEQVVDRGEEHAIRINERIAVNEDGLELLNGTQGAPHPCRQANKAHRPIDETLRELEHVDEILQHTGNAAVV